MVAELTPVTANQLIDLPSVCLAIAEHAPWPMAAAEGARHTMRYVNPAFCRLMNQSREELIGKPFAEMKMMPERDECLALLDQVYQTGEPESHTEPDGSAPHSPFWSYASWPVRGADERVVGVMLQVTETAKFRQRSAEMSEALMLAVLRQHELAEASDLLNAQLQTEIAERKRAEQELVAAKDEISRHAQQLEKTVIERTADLRDTIGELEAFSYSLSHDMRAPLRAMRGFATLLLEQHAGKLDAEGIKYLEKITTAGARMDALIQDVLTYTRVAAEKMTLDPIDTDALVREVMESYPQLQADNAEVHIEGVLPNVLGNNASLAQCLSNLLVNAVKFVAPGTKPRVTIRGEDVGAEVRLWIEDNGIGIDPKDQKRIFIMFERVHPESAYEGTGIGLAIVRKAAERMGGTVGVQSAIGQGSKFWIQLKKG